MLIRAALMLASMLALVACGATEKGAPLSIALDGEAMGTTWSVLVADSIDPEELARAIASELNAVEDEMSHYREGSELSRLNRSSVEDWVSVSPGFARCVALAKVIGEASGGAFDVTLGPVIDAWGFGTERRREIPTDAALATARRRVGHGLLEVRVDRPAIKKRRADLELNLSAIAKGHGVDRIAMVVEQHGVTDYLVEIGGEVRVSGSKHGKPWRVAIERPRIGDRALNEPVSMTSGAVATSGDYRIFWRDQGKNYSHLIDPRTARPVSHILASASVFAETCAEADAWATTMMVLGPDAALALAADLELAVLLIVRKEQGVFEQRTSPAFDARFGT